MQSSITCQTIEKISPLSCNICICSTRKVIISQSAKQVSRKNTMPILVSTAFICPMNGGFHYNQRKEKKRAMENNI